MAACPSSSDFQQRIQPLSPWARSTLGVELPTTPTKGPASISSLPVIAKILGEMGLMRRNFGQLTLAAGMANDVIGWVALGLIAGLAQAGGLKLDKLAFTVVGLIVFFVVAFTVGQRVVDTALKRVRANGGDQLSGMTVVLVTTLSFGVVTQWLHVEAVLGAFIAGVILARSRFAEHELIRPLETMTAAVFAPIFFATAGSAEKDMVDAVIESQANSGQRLKSMIGLVVGTVTSIFGVLLSLLQFSRS